MKRKFTKRPVLSSKYIAGSELVTLNNLSDCQNYNVADAAYAIAERLLDSDPSWDTYTSKNIVVNDTIELLSDPDYMCMYDYEYSIDPDFAYSLEFYKFIDDIIPEGDYDPDGLWD